MKRKDHLFAILILIAAMLACNLPGSQPEEAVSPTETRTVVNIESTLPPTETAVSATSTPEPTATHEPSPTSNVVTITASGGNINIRRGPGVGYNPIAVFANGQSAVAAARNADGSWLNISIPGGSGQGWVNAKTQYSSVTGDVTLLPVKSVDAPKPAYIRNCTFHAMLVKPGEIKIKEQTYSPDNKLQFNPGNYEVFDTTVSGNKPVREINLREGDTIDITRDGLGNPYSCP